jgi:hypothetical protein
MQRLVFFSVLLISLHTFSMVATAQQLIECPDTLASRLVPDMIARVTPGDSNRVRDMPSTSGNSIGFIPSEGEFYVLAGPVCSDGFAWWFVEHEGLVGWTVEGSNSYWIEPVNSDFVVPPRDFGAEESTSFAFLGMRLDLSNQIAAQATAELVADVPPDSGVFSMSIAPEHTYIEFEGWEDLYNPYLAIYPAEAYADYRNYDLEILRTTLTEQTAAPPYVGPIINAAIHFYVQPQYVNFMNGSGIRSIVHWSQNTNLITDGGVLYVYSGLTDDGQYLVQLVFPLESPRLATFYTVIGDNWDYTGLSGDTYSTYLDVAEGVMAQHPPQEFDPQLSQLDALIASLDLTAYNQDVMQDSDGNECVTRRSRLLVNEFARQALAESSLRVRDMPAGNTTGDNVLAGELVQVLSGPECVDNTAWWEIASDEGWSGWVAESGEQNYYFEPVTRTPTPTATYTPAPPTNTPTLRPNSTRSPTLTPSVSDCIITPIFASVLRSEPDVDSYRLQTISDPFYAIAQYQRRGEEFPWWQLGSQVETRYPNRNFVAGRWIRADFVTEEGPCESLPLYEYDDD